MSLHDVYQTHEGQGIEGRPSRLDPVRPTRLEGKTLTWRNLRISHGPNQRQVRLYVSSPSDHAHAERYDLSSWTRRHTRQPQSQPRKHNTGGARAASQTFTHCQEGPDSVQSSKTQMYKTTYYCRWCGKVYSNDKATDRDGYCSESCRLTHQKAYEIFKPYQLALEKTLPRRVGFSDPKIAP
ncbi:hypothetical protein ES703_26301 [subsurface metagenome]